MNSALRSATLALGLRSTPQSLGVVGAALGEFARHGVDLRVVREETAGPEGILGLVRGEYDFAELGVIPAVWAALDGHDPLLVFAAEPVSALYVLGAAGVVAPDDLKGARIGVLSRDGQTGESARMMLERWQLADAVELVELGTYPAIYQALADGRTQGGILTADYWMAGRLRHGFTILADLGRELMYQGPVLATTKRLRESRPELLQAVVRGYLASLRRFREDGAAVVPLLKTHLRFVDLDEARAIHRFYAARFSAEPFPSEAGIDRVIRAYARRRPEVSLAPSDLYDPLFLRTALQP